MSVTKISFRVVTNIVKAGSKSNKLIFAETYPILSPYKQI